jgi:GT2 family glycosyltransferase
MTLLSLGSGVKTIGEAAFSDCYSVQSLELPSSLTSIGTKGFYRCESITTVTVPSSVTSMGVSVFAYCADLVSANVQASIRTLPEYTFYGCSCLVHKRVFEEIGVFDESLRLLNDRDMWYRIYVGGYKIHFLPEALTKGRIHGAQVSKSIGYSYHNPEQDMFWKRSLDWLLKNHSDEKQLFFLFGRNAYLKTRNTDGDRAFAHIADIYPRERGKLRLKKLAFKVRAALRSFAKKIYLKIKT